jgi:Uma2 family endonuclease
MDSTTQPLTLAELLVQFGPISAARLRHDPPPGCATQQDVTEIEAREDRLYELFDGVLLEKVMGFYESFLAGLLVQFLGSFVREHDLGVVVGADGILQLPAQQVRIPDVSFVSWQRLGGRELPAEPIPMLAPDLVVEVISEGNTAEEMNRKLKDYFAAQVRQLWYVYPDTKSVFVYKGTQEPVAFSGEAVLDGGELLPGFQLSLKQLFAQPQRTSGG